MKDIFCSVVSADEIAELTAKFVQIPSLSGEEDKMAASCQAAMQKAGFEEVGIDEAGNVIGFIKGSGEGRSILYHAHMDHVPPGEMKNPFSGNIIDSSIYGSYGKAVYGRGAADNKGSLAAMIMAIASMKRAGRVPPGDLYVTGVVMEELTGSPGSRHLMTKQLQTDLVVIGEPTNLNIALGHRSSVHFDVIIRGVSAHASNPGKGCNALYPLGLILKELAVLNSGLPADDIFGSSTLAACNVSVSPGQRSVVPDLCSLSINFRGVPQFRVEEMEKLLNGILQKALDCYPGIKGEVKLASERTNTYTGLEVDLTGSMIGFYTDPQINEIKKAFDLGKNVCRLDIELDKWNFATDGGVFDSYGVLTFGLGAGEERFTHSALEHINIEDLHKASNFYACLPWYI